MPYTPPSRTPKGGSRDGSDSSSIAAFRALMTSDSLSTTTASNIDNSYKPHDNSTENMPPTATTSDVDTVNNHETSISTEIESEKLTHYNNNLKMSSFQVPSPPSKFYFQGDDDEEEEEDKVTDKNGESVVIESKIYKEELEDEKAKLKQDIANGSLDLFPGRLDNSKESNESSPIVQNPPDAKKPIKKTNTILKQSFVNLLAADARRPVSSRNSSIELMASSVTASTVPPLKSESASKEEVFEFTNASPQSYSYTLLSPNSLALRVNVLKRSLQILVERPELLNSMQSDFSLPTDSQLSKANKNNTDNQFCMQRNNASSVTLSTLLQNTQQSRRESSFVASPMTSMVGSNQSYFTELHPSPKNSDSRQASSNKQLIKDLKKVIQLIENGISSMDFTSDKLGKANIVENLQNLTLSNITQMSEGRAMRINLLHALSTPFIENGAKSQPSVAGMPYFKAAPSSVALTSLNRNNSDGNNNESNRSTNSNNMINNNHLASKVFQYHTLSTKKAAPKAILTCSLDNPWTIKNANDLGLLMFGISKNSMNSLTLMDLIAPRSRNFVLNKLLAHKELIFSGEILAISRTGGQGIAWTSLWAKRKEEILLLIFEQIPCDAIDLIIEKSDLLEDNSSYTVKSHVETSSSLFRDFTLSGLPLSTVIPSLNTLLETENDLNDTNYSSYKLSQKHSMLINAQRYFTLNIRNSFIPCAVTSEPLDYEENTKSSIVRLNVHCLHYIAGTFVISANTLEIMAFNEAIAKNLFGNANIRNKSIDFIIPSFSNLLEDVKKSIPDLNQKVGLVLPEHYFRKLHANRVGKTAEEKELLFLNSSGIDGSHLDGNMIHVDVQMRVIDDGLFVLWITYSRNASSIGSSSRAQTRAQTRNPSVSSVHSLAVTITNDKEEADLSELGMSLKREENLSENQFNNLPSQLKLISNEQEDFSSAPSSEVSLSRESSLRHSSRSADALKSADSDAVITRKRSDNELTRGSSLSSLSSSSSTSYLNKDSYGSEDSASGHSSTSAAKVDAYKLSQIASEAELLAQEKKLLDSKIKKSTYWPKKVGMLKREKKITDFQIIKSMGEGAYGKVSLCVHKKDPFYQVVIKAIIKERILVDTWVRDRNLGFVPSEIQIMNFMKNYPHPNLMQIVDYFEDETYYYLETPEHGDPPAIDLFDLIEVKSDMTELECKYIFYQCSSGLAHLHSHGVVHRDIKDDNIIVDKNYVAKIIDFGSAAHVTKGPFGVFVGTIDYAAPEVISGKPYTGKPQDVWAMGVLLYTLVFKENPFYTVDDIMDGGYTLPAYHNISADCIDLINMILIKDYNARPTMNDILKHKWFAGMK